MSSSMKLILFVFLPVFSLIFFQVEQGRIGKANHKSGYYEDQGDVSSDSDDDTISINSCDDDADDFSESIIRLLPVATSPTFSTAEVLYHSTYITPTSRQIFYRDVSPSFLRVFRI